MLCTFFMGGILVEGDTICAISTALGIGGIAIIRVSGPKAIETVSEVFRGKDLKNVESHTINYGKIVLGSDVIDECLVSVMRSPKTYTTEDIVEINIHGGIATTNRVLEILLEKGLRLAEPGEFTKRAFLNGRIDLVQAEAVSDIINAETESARNMSINQIGGTLSKIIREFRERLIGLEANIEVNIDYPEYEDIEEMTVQKVNNVISSIIRDFDKLIEESKTGKIIKRGIDIALIGRPNVGKSSVLNTLLEENKAIVTDIEGTTRDIVEGRMVLKGTMVNFIDTAGIRKTDNIVEKIGVDRSLERLNSADFVILILDGSRDITFDEYDLIKKIENRPHLIFVNKNDLPLKENFSKIKAVFGNTITESGLDALKEAICEAFSLDTLPKRDMTYLSNARQLSLITLAKKSLLAAHTALSNGTPVDIVSADIKKAREYLGEITGDTYSEELIDELFSKFCLGK